MPQVARGLVPNFPALGMVGDHLHVLGETVHEETLTSPDDRGMQRAAMGWQQREVGRFPDTVVREIETLPCCVQYAAANELFDALSRVVIGEPDRVLEELELKLATDDRGNVR